MIMASRICIILIAALIAALPARAATTVFASSVTATGAVTGANNALGPPNGAAAIVDTGGILTFQFNNPLTGANVFANLLALPAGQFNVIAVNIGEVVGGVATFSGDFLIVDDGSGVGASVDLTSACSAISATGCSLLRFRNAMSLMGSTGFQLDAVSGVSNVPEPATWALMILGFAGIAWRLKRSRVSGSRKEELLSPRGFRLA